MELRIALICARCGENFSVTKSNHYYRTKNGSPRYCHPCLIDTRVERMAPEVVEKCRLASSKTLKRLRATQTPEQKSAFAKLARSKVDSASAVRKQWDTIKSDPEQFEALKKRRVVTSKARWDAMLPDDKVAHFKKVFANKTGKSKAADAFIAQIIASGIPVEPEQGVQGFIVDGLVREQKLMSDLRSGFH